MAPKDQVRFRMTGIQDNDNEVWGYFPVDINMPFPDKECLADRSQAGRRGLTQKYRKSYLSSEIWEEAPTDVGWRR